jgi:hypothetical protein
MMGEFALIPRIDIIQIAECVLPRSIINETNWLLVGHACRNGTLWPKSFAVRAEEVGKAGLCNAYPHGSLELESTPWIVLAQIQGGEDVTTDGEIRQTGLPK